MWTRRLEIWLTKLLKNTIFTGPNKTTIKMEKHFLKKGRNCKLAKQGLHILWANIHIEKPMPSSLVPFWHDKTSSLLQWVTHCLLTRWRLREAQGEEAIQLLREDVEPSSTFAALPWGRHAVQFPIMVPYHGKWILGSFTMSFQCPKVCTISGSGGVGYGIMSHVLPIGTSSLFSGRRGSCIVPSTHRMIEKCHCNSLRPTENFHTTSTDDGVSNKN